MCKFHLLHILGDYVDKPNAESEGIFLFNQHIRSLIGKVLNEDEKLGHHGPYVPLFYSTAATNEIATVSITKSKHHIMRLSIFH